MEGAEIAAFGHGYEAVARICQRELTAEEGRDFISRFTVPTVFVGIPHPPGEHFVSSGLHFGGYVTTSYAPDGWSGQNVTTPAHFLVGTVERRLAVVDGATDVRTHGTGNAGGAFGTVRDWVNQYFGGPVFESVDREAVFYSKRTYPGC